MVTIRYVFQCDVCGRKATDDKAGSLIWGIDWQRSTLPALPEGWKILADRKILTEGGWFGGKLICAQHVCDIRDARYTEIIEAVLPRRV